MSSKLLHQVVVREDLRVAEGTSVRQGQVYLWNHQPGTQSAMQLLVRITAVSKNEQGQVNWSGSIKSVISQAKDAAVSRTMASNMTGGRVTDLYHLCSAKEIETLESVYQEITLAETQLLPEPMAVYIRSRKSGISAADAMWKAIDAGALDNRTSV